MVQSLHTVSNLFCSKASKARGTLRRNHGCNVPHCVLCKHNPNKRCTGNFAGKYWVGDRLLAKCEGEIQVELIDATTGDRVVDDLSSYRLQVCHCFGLWFPLDRANCLLLISTTSWPPTCPWFRSAARYILRHEEM